MITASKEESSALEAVRLGAFDYCSKPIRLDEIKLIVRRAFHMQQLQQRLQETCLQENCLNIAHVLKPTELGFAGPIPAGINLKLQNRPLKPISSKKLLQKIMELLVVLRRTWVSVGSTSMN